MKTALFDFKLPDERIALRPCEPRDAARMLVVDPNDQATPNGVTSFQDNAIRDLPMLLREDDVLITNDTRVIPAAMSGTRTRGDARANISCNLIKRNDANAWQALVRPAKKLAIGDEIRFGNVNLAASTGQLTATVVDTGEDGRRTLAFNMAGADLDKAITTLGQMPIPPYIAGKRDADASDNDTYQTIFARADGAVAAPTAGLHFTTELLKALDALGIERHSLTLHVGAGTFLPVKTDDTNDHKMHAEWGEVTQSTANAISKARQQGRRIIAVGTTSLRLLESAARDDGTIAPFQGDTSIFIEPGYKFKAVDALITNFHLPRSTLFMLVSAFAGLEVMQSAYAHAIEEQYRFYSYGDANLLFRQK